MTRRALYYAALLAALLMACRWVVRDDGVPQPRGHVEDGRNE